MNLQGLREQIDAIDRQWMALLSQRVKVAEQIAMVKKKAALPISDAEREKAMLAEIRRWADEGNISPQFAETIFQQVIDYSKQEMLRATEGKRP